MKKNFNELHVRELRGGLFLSSMLDITDGNFCFERSEGCSMVQLGAYMAEPLAYGKKRFYKHRILALDNFLPPTREDCEAFFRKELKKFKGLSKIFTCLNLATPKLEWGLEATECFHRAGGDFIELCINGDYEPYVSQGKLMAMVLPENRDELFNWIEAFTKLDIPLIVKFKMGAIDDYSPILNKIKYFNIFGVHFDVRDEEKKKPDFSFVREVKRDSSFLLVSGYVRSAIDAKMLFEAGADMVGIAEPTINDPSYIHNITKNL